jgi:hypothetical protein
MMVQSCLILHSLSPHALEIPVPISKELHVGEVLFHAVLEQYQYNGALVDVREVSFLALGWDNRPVTHEVMFLVAPPLKACNSACSDSVTERC